MLSSNKNKIPKIFINFSHTLKKFSYDLNIALAASTVSDQVYIILSNAYYKKLTAHKIYKKQLLGLQALGIKLILTPAPIPAYSLKIKKPDLINYNELVDLLAIGSPPKYR